MKNSYIFLQKKKNLVYNNFSEYIKSECKPDSKNVFKFEYNFKTYKLKYNEKEEKNNLEEKIIYVEIEIEGEDKKSAEILGYFESKFKSDGNLMKSFGIVNSYDQVSLYYTNILYSYLNEFERNIRDLVFTFFIKLFGAKWTKETMEEDTINKIKENGKTSLLAFDEIEALYGFTIYELEQFLFEPMCSNKTKKNFNEILENESYKQMDHQELVEFIESINPKSHWDKYFSQIQITDFKDKLYKIRSCRNTIAHCKHMNKIEFDTFVDIFKETTQIIKNAVIEAKNMVYEISDMESSIEFVQDISENRNIMASIASNDHIMKNSTLMKLHSTLMKNIEEDKKGMFSIASNDHIIKNSTLMKLHSTLMKNIEEDKKV